MVIGFRGLAGAGKTTICDHITRICASRNAHYSGAAPFISRRSLAGPLKDGLAMMGITKPECPDLYRRAATYIGTDIVRVHDPDWWVKLFRQRAALETKDGYTVLVDDIRFPN